MLERNQVYSRPWHDSKPRNIQHIWYQELLIFIYPVHGRHSIIHRADELFKREYCQEVWLIPQCRPVIEFRSDNRNYLVDPNQRISGRQFGGEGGGGYTYPWPPYLKGYTYHGDIHITVTPAHTRGEEGGGGGRRQRQRQRQTDRQTETEGGIGIGNWKISLPPSLSRKGPLKSKQNLSLDSWKLF